MLLWKLKCLIRCVDSFRMFYCNPHRLMSVLHVLKIAVFGALGFAFAQWVPLVAAMIVTGYAGTLWGTALLDRMPEDAFRKGFRILLTLLAIDMIRRGAMAWAG